jgi:hypothetical protein
MSEFVKDFIPPAVESFGPTIKIGRFEYYSIHAISIALNVPARHLINQCRQCAFPGRKIGLTYLVPSDLGPRFLNQIGAAATPKARRVRTLEDEVNSSRNKEKFRVRWNELKPSEKKIEGFLSPLILNDVYYFTLHQLARKIGVQLRILQRNVYLPYSTLVPEGTQGLVSDTAFHEWVVSDNFTPEKRSLRVAKPKQERKPRVRKKGPELPIVKQDIA